MATKGRPKTLENRTNTSISLPQEFLDFVKASGKDNSAYIRELIAEKMKSMESPVGKLRQEIAEREKHVEDELFLIQMLKTRLAEEEENEARKQQEIEETEEKEAKLKEYIIGKFNFIANSRARSTKTRIETKKPWQFSLQPRNRHQLPVTKVYIIALAASLLALCFFPAWPVLVEEPKVQVQVKIGLLVAPSISKE